jgi:3-oxoacyl-[acyl-carrier protein] reductase
MVMNKTHLNESVVLITGANGGIGRAVCTRFENEGACVYKTDAMDSTEARFIKGDLLDPAFPQQCLQQVIEEAGRIDILVNGAGICPRTALPDILRDEWDKVMNINLTSVFQLSQVCMDAMVKRKQGVIINIASLAGKVGGIAVGAHYSASKAALVCLTKTLARYGAPHGVRVNAVAPGVIDTAITRDASDEEQKRLLASIPLGRFGLPDEVAGAILFLASQDASYITGATLDINGGVLMD